MIRGKSPPDGKHVVMLTEPTSQDFKSQKIFDQISVVLADDGEALVGRVKGIYLFKVKGGANGAEGKWILDAKNGAGSVEFDGKGIIHIFFLNFFTIIFELYCCLSCLSY